jgi:hypothetical protein
MNIINTIYFTYGQGRDTVFQRQAVKASTQGCQGKGKGREGKREAWNFFAALV